MKTVCKICGKLVTKKNILRHVQSHGDQNFTCNICDKHFSTRDYQHHGLNPLLSGPRNGFWSIFGHLIEFGLVAQLSKQPQNGFYKVNQDMGRKFKTARVGPPLHGIGSVKSIVLIREHPQFMWPACDFFIFGYKLAIFGHLSSIFLVAKNDHK